MSDRERVLQLLRQARSAGVHSHELRLAGITGNPSQRVIELQQEGHQIEHRRERRNDRNGVRYVLISEASGFETGKAKRTSLEPGGQVEGGDAPVPSGIVKPLDPAQPYAVVDPDPQGAVVNVPSAEILSTHPTLESAFEARAVCERFGVRIAGLEDGLPRDLDDNELIELDCLISGDSEERLAA